MPDVPTMVAAKFDFEPSNGTELKLVKGVRYQVTRRVDDNWYSGKDSSGGSGIFPISYVEAVVDLSGELAGRPSKRRRAELSFSYSRQRTEDISAGAAAASRYNPALPTAPTKPTDRLPYHVHRLPVESAMSDARYMDTRVNRTSTIRPIDSSAVSAVHIFDLDETLIQFNHLGALYIPPRQLGARPGEAAVTPNRAAGKALSKALEELIIGVASAHFFFDDLEGCNQTDVKALTHLDDRAPLDALDFDEDGFTWPKGAPPGLAHPAWTRLAHRLRAMEDRYGTAAGATAAGAAARRPTPAAAAVCTHVTKHRYEQTTDKSLGFAAGAPVDVLQAADGGWARVRIAAAVGWAPASYLREVGVEEAFPELASMAAAGVLSQEHLAAVADLHRDLSAYTEGWLDTALRLLHALQHVQGCELVLVTNSELSAALTKCLLFRLGPYFRADNIYSSATAGKPAVFKRIRERYGADPFYCAYGDGPEERSAAEELKIPFRQVQTAADLQKLCRQAELNDGRLHP